MTKRRVANDLAEASEETLGDLSPDERLQLVLNAAAEDNDDWLDRLQETCPRHAYWVRGRQYMRRLRFAYTLALQAVYDLHTTLLMFKWLSSRHWLTMVVGFQTELGPEKLGVVDEAWSPGTLLRELAASYGGYERFAEEELGVPVVTWLSVHPNGEHVAQSVAEVLEDRAGLLRVTEEDPLDLADGRDDRIPVDELADRWYRDLRMVWRDAVEHRS